MKVSDPHIYKDLAYLYGPDQVQAIVDRLENILVEFRQMHPNFGKQSAGNRVTEKDAILITYADMVQEEGLLSLAALAGFLETHLSNVVSTVHILPFFPYSSDDGFSVIDYRAVDPSLGGWQEVAQFGNHFRLMFDVVINHISRESAWFQGFLGNDPRYRDYFIVVEPGTDLSMVFRPRALPLLTAVAQESDQGETVERLVWTTFSSDQFDLNFSCPDLLLDIIEILLFYVAQGAEFIRLDAVAYLWKEIGTNCLHLPQTHRLIQLIRHILDQVAPKVAIITETNVPHQDNISYFGDGINEAQMVYNFSLPPLTLHAFHTGDARTLSQWADTLALPSENVTFFNFLASHDGIGLTPLEGILSDGEIDALAARVEALGGRVSSKSNADGSTSPYELNINYLDALGDPQKLGEDPALIARRFLASQAIMLSLQGVPGIYFHSLLGSRGWPAGMEKSGRSRSINREKLQQPILESDLAEPSSLRHQVFYGFRLLLAKRRIMPAFHPNADQRVLFIHEAIFSLLRTSPDSRFQVICLHNVSDQTHEISIDMADLAMDVDSHFLDLVRDAPIQASASRLAITINPYQVLWLQRL